MTRAARWVQALPLLCAVFFLAGRTLGADAFDAALAHAGRSPADLKRDGLDHPAEMLRLAAIKPGMKVADILAGDGYYSELVSYLVGPKGEVYLINNAAFDHWSEDDLKPRLAGERLGNLKHETLDLNDMKLPPASLDAVLLVKVFHDLYWVDSSASAIWPKINVGAVLDQLALALKPGGVLLLIDHSAKKNHGSADASALHRMDEEFAIKEIKAHGFTVAKQSDLLRRPDDQRDLVSYKGPALGKTDRFVVVFRKS